MFEGLKSMGDLAKLMANARAMQDKVKQMQETLAAKTVSADAGAGVVEATVNGRLELVRLRIDKARVDMNDVEMIEDLVVAAVRAAQAKAAQLMKDEMARAAEEMGLPPNLMP